MLIRLFKNWFIKKLHKFWIVFNFRISKAEDNENKWWFWKDVPIQNVTKIPENIDGTCIYELPYDPVDRHTSSKDRRPWKKSIRSDKSIYKSSIVYFSKSINIHQIYCFGFTRTLHINNKIKKSFFFLLNRVGNQNGNV